VSSVATTVAVRKAWNTTMKKLFAFCAMTSLVLGEAAAEDRVDRIDLTGFACKQFLAIIVTTPSS
jgi:hypothetical protein